MEATSDLSFNDLHYKINKLEANQTPLSQNILLINSGSLSQENFRDELAELLLVIETKNPKVIAIDHDFDNNVSKPGTEKLISVFQSLPNLVLASDTTRNKLVINSVEYGTVRFPESIFNIRKYYTNENTFAAKTAKKINADIAINNNKESFLINYIADDYYNISSNNYPFESYDEFTFSEFSSNFPLLEASDILDNSDWNQYHLQNFIADKIILIGHVGNVFLTDYKNDLEDKFPVPCDTNSLIFRQRTMPGLLIHANAIENLLDPEKQFLVLNDKIWFVILEELFIIIYICFLIFFRVGKLINIIVMLSLSLPLLYLVLFGMKHLIYIEMGGTLLSLLIFEELIEMIEPFYLKMKSKLLN